jgi:hypothetical protein
MPYTLEVDFDVYKAVFARRANESVTENDVLRELLGLEPRITAYEGPADSPPRNAVGSPHGWTVKGVHFPEGTDFRAKYKGTHYTGRVQAGSLVVEGNSYDSPSAAAVAITGNPVNGWRFWECQLPGKPTWQLIDSLRR